MTSTATGDVPATVAQIARLAEAGCEIVRLAVPTPADAGALPEIRRALAARGVRVPLVADIHFAPATAMKAVEHVEKIRINPGNFAGRRRSPTAGRGVPDHDAELARIEDALVPLARRCRELGVPMRIGTNHGSLSERILSRHGDTPEGMVESALEFVRICERAGFRDLVLSMKASNPVVALRAYRLLVARMDAERMDYPLHLGVTEAGEGEDGRVKSAIGIGALLEEGIGDTVRVSLTEDPVAEIPVARALVAPYNDRPVRVEFGFDAARGGCPAAPGRRAARAVRFGPAVAGGGRPPLVEVPLGAEATDGPAVLRGIEAAAGPRVPPDARADLVSIRVATVEDAIALARLRGSIEKAAPGLAVSARLEPAGEPARLPALLASVATAAHRLHLRAGASPEGADDETLRRVLEAAAASGASVLLEAGAGAGGAGPAADRAAGIALGSPGIRDRLALAIDPTCGSPLLAGRRLAERLDRDGTDAPIVLVDRPAERGADPLLGSSAVLGGLLCEGIGDAVHIEAGDAETSRRLAFSVLQASRARITRTEFISCPSCGRTSFDIESATARIKSRTAHLKGLKIAIMGCVVNGPGEMADADFGYVGWGMGRIALFAGKEMVEKDVPAEEADDRLVDLIRRRGRWTDPPGGEPLA